MVSPSISTYFRFRKFVVPLQRFLKPNFVVHEQMGCDVRNGDVFIFINGERKQKRQELARPIMVGLKAWMESEGVKTTSFAETMRRQSIWQLSAR